MKKEFIFILLAFSFQWLNAAQEDETLLIRISYSDSVEEARVKALGFNILEEKPGEYIETRMRWEQILRLNSQDFKLTYVIEINKTSVDSGLHSFTEVRNKLARLQRDFPQILEVRTIGETGKKKNPLLAVVLSDEPGQVQDRPAVLITGAHHAREPLSTEICLHLIDQFCHKYQQDVRFAHWLKKVEIWIIPVVNPDGYSLIFNGNQQHRLWRKNLRDNNENGNFDTEFDGVDLNRNYDFNWELGGSSNVQSQFYRGPAPFSENETKALKGLVENRQFAFIVDFHSFGEAVLYPWSNFKEPPDLELITRLAEKMAGRIKSVKNTSTYETIPLDAQMGQSSVWHYGKHGILSFIIEAGDTYFPPTSSMKKIISQNTNAVYFLLDRLQGARLSGHVLDILNRKPVIAKIYLISENKKRLQPIYSEPCFGRFDRVVLPGNYSLEIVAAGYQTKRILNIQVNDSLPVELNIYAEPTEEMKTENE